MRNRPNQVGNEETKLVSNMRDLIGAGKAPALHVKGGGGGWSLNYASWAHRDMFRDHRNLNRINNTNCLFIE